MDAKGSSEQRESPRKRAHVAIVLLIWASVLTVPVAAVSAQPPSETTCVGVITGAHDNVVVPPRATCTISNATVKGNVKALQDSHLWVNMSTVGGNIDGDKAEEVRLTANTIGGNVQIKEGEAPEDGQFGSDVVLCANTLTTGNVHVEKMNGSIVIGRVRAGGCLPNTISVGNIIVQENIIPQGRFAGLDLEGNTIGFVDQDGGRHGGNLQVFKNVGPGMKFVTANTVVNGVIQCYENSQPFVGGPNFGRAPDQPPPLMPLAGPNQCFGTPTP